jgi:hypothetical protein
MPCQVENFVGNMIWRFLVEPPHIGSKSDPIALVWRGGIVGRVFLTLDKAEMRLSGDFEAGILGFKIDELDEDVGDGCEGPLGGHDYVRSLMKRI